MTNQWRTLEDGLPIHHQPVLIAFKYDWGWRYYTAKFTGKRWLETHPEDNDQFAVPDRWRYIEAPDSPAVEPTAPQAPIAKVTVRESGAGHYAPDDVYVSLYAPGLPPGEHDLYCEPMSVAPALKSSAPHVHHFVHTGCLEPSKVDPKLMCESRCECGAELCLPREQNETM